MKKFLILWVFVFASSSHLIAQSPEKSLLASAIKIYASIDPDIDIKTRIKSTELVIKKIDEVLENHADTDIGLEMLISDKFGNYSISELRSKYLNDVISYNLKSCGASPSYSCFGFISLTNGRQDCSSGDDFSNFLSASDNFKNAYQIFKSQGDEKKNSQTVMQSYRGCVAKAPNKFSKDFINSRLIEVLLNNGDEKKAVGITQNMSTKLFKLTSAADIRVSQGKYDLDTVYTLISKTDDLETPEDKAIYVISLLNKYYDNVASPLNSPNSNINHPAKKLDALKNDINCSLSQGKYASELALELMLNFRSDYNPAVPGPNFSTAMQAAQSSADVARLCQDKVNINFMNKMDYLSHKHQLQLASFMKKNGSEEIDVANFILKNFDLSLVREIVSKNNTHAKNTIAMFEGKGFGPKAMENKVSEALYPFSGIDAKVALFKWEVDNGDVCASSDIFFKELRGSKSEAEVISYFTQSPNILPTQKYNCGDEDLDLLIN